MSTHTDDGGQTRTGFLSRKVVIWASWDVGSSAFNSVVTTFVFSVYLTTPKLFGPSANANLGWTTALAGILVALYYGTITPYMGFVAGMKAFTAAVLGGIGSIPGAMLGGFILGLSESFASAYLASEYKDLVAFSLLIVVLLIRPSGILGKPEVEKV